MRSSHTLDRLVTTFDDDRLVADAGLLLPATLAHHLGLREFVAKHLQLGRAAGRANAGDKLLTLLMSALAGGDCIDDSNALRAGATARVLGFSVKAPSTLGTFLRSFRWGHVRQLDAVSRGLLARAWAAGAAPAAGALTIDLDSTLCETYGLAKQGGAAYTYARMRGYHPLLAVLAGSGEVLHARLRGGVATSGRGAASFIAETVSRLRAAGADGPLVLRADAGFYGHAVVEAARRAKANFSITVRSSAVMRRTIEELPEAAWRPIPGWPGAELAETSYIPFDQRPRPCAVRLIVRRVLLPEAAQLAFFARYHHWAFITDRPGDAVVLEADHRGHAEVENIIRELKYGVGLNHLPSGRFAANAAWLAVQVMAHNLARWTSRIGLAEESFVTTKTLRRRLFALVGRLTRSARRLTVHLLARWPWRVSWAAALGRLRAIPLLA
ncbi:MAG TPA: IS1380 family transposase [Kofleriaceae bacterium]|nr:IS1380 family transposase [Kofleriaceae bacterium]